MTNSLSLKQCHLWDKVVFYFLSISTNLFKACTTQTGYVFYPSFVVVILMGNRTAAAPLATRSNDAQRRHAPPV